ncbi:hypothetical protein FHS39_004355 [Streptomyces olivoverticillatus]|uniref:Uncharacterized protein n=1 Tax=Streptomyces olivoverticillatus TaxID=66427 RepID=A0A7W7LT32_9ACTN|nr:hypothetical protein [Streptomyces olivoverticillatus]MBB4895288.1 hypothetical protein [Streptomyces olivoverticillatus]
MPDMDEIIRRIRRDMDTQLRKRASQARGGPSGWTVSGEAAADPGSGSPAQGGRFTSAGAAQQSGGDRPQHPSPARGAAAGPARQPGPDGAR